MYDKVKLVSLEELQVRNEDLQSKNEASLALVQRTKGELLNATQELVVADAALAASEARVATLNVRTAPRAILVPKCTQKFRRRNCGLGMSQPCATVSKWRTLILGLDVWGVGRRRRGRVRGSVVSNSLDTGRR